MGKFGFQRRLGAGGPRGVLSKACIENKGVILAPQVGFEPTTLRLTAECSMRRGRTIFPEANVAERHNVSPEVSRTGRRAANVQPTCSHGSGWRCLWLPDRPWTVSSNQRVTARCRQAQAGVPHSNPGAPASASGVELPPRSPGASHSPRVSKTARVKTPRLGRRLRTATQIPELIKVAEVRAKAPSQRSLARRPRQSTANARQPEQQCRGKSPRRLASPTPTRWTIYKRRWLILFFGVIWQRTSGDCRREASRLD